MAEALPRPVWYSSKMKIAMADSDWVHWLLAFTISAATMLAMPVLFSGCRKSQTITQDMSQQSQTNQFLTPSALLGELRMSLLKNDEASFLKCFAESGSFKQCLQMTFRRVQATIRFRDAMLEIYGEKGWDQFQQLGDELGARPRLTPNVVPIGQKYWNKLEVQTEGEQAVFFNPVTQMTNAMQKSASGWKINARSAFGQDVDPVKLASYLKSTTDAIEEMTLAIRTNRTPIADVGFELFQKVAAKRSVP